MVIVENHSVWNTDLVENYSVWTMDVAKYSSMDHG